jgi:glycosyltransferase involved in cell wall biosynthesis
VKQNEIESLLQDKDPNPITTKALFKKQADILGACVLIPTYNNAITLGQVITDVLEYTAHVIVVDDGSTDDTKNILQSFPQIKVISYLPNKGKGWALRQGLRYAAENGYRYAITIDSDGQHFAKDLPVFLDKIEAEPDALLIGARNMDQESVPGKSSFGNRFSSFWFRVETGIKGPDTQSGYRLYPLKPLGKMHFITRKYEFEIEVLVRAAWKGVKIDWVPVSVYYAPKEERVSHFRPFKDFFRISVLNTILVLVTFLYIKPRDFVKGVFDSQKRKQVWNDYFLVPGESDEVKAMSIAFGVFMGIVPIWGFQLALAIFLAILFKLNKPLVIVAANISIPPMIPLIIFASIKTGALWMGKNAIDISFTKSISLLTIQQSLKQYLIGATTLAVVAGVFFGVLSYALLKIKNSKIKSQN